MLYTVALTKMADKPGLDKTFIVIHSVICLIVVAAVTIPASVVIGVIIHKKELHKYHYWFVVNLMISNIITALTVNPVYLVLYLIKLFSTTKASINCGYALAFLYIAPISSAFMVLNLAIDAVLAITYPLKYEKLMTKTKAILMVVIAWMLAASFTLPLVASPELDVEVDDFSLCPNRVNIFLALPVVRVGMAVMIIGINIYLYWKVFKAKQKLKCLVEVSTRECSSTTKDLRARMKKYKSFVRLSVTLLLIVVVDGLLRILRVMAAIVATENDVIDNNVFKILFNLATWIEYINHPVVYGLMLREVYKTVFCKA